MQLSPTLLAELQDWKFRLEADGTLRPKEALDGWYQTFRQRFGPTVLAGLDGEALLDTMHDHGRRDSLVYWLEFKDDEELPAIFGSIAGGSALKFGIYRRKETGKWTVGTPADQRVISTDEAIAVARRHRDQLLAGAAILTAMPRFSADAALTDVDAAYGALQKELDRVAPDVADSSWGHKYFSMFASDRLDDYHSANHQRHHLLRLGILTPAGEGRYLMAGRYVLLAAELGLPLTSLATLLNRRSGSPRQYWRIGTTDDQVPRKFWSVMRDEGCAVVGYPKTGDLAGLSHDTLGKEALRELMRPYYPTDPATLGRQLQQIFNFRHWIKEGDVVLAADGMKILGIGVVTAGYHFEPSLAAMPHRVSVRWQHLGEWSMDTKEGLMKTCSFLSKPASIVQVERTLLAAGTPGKQGTGPAPEKVSAPAKPDPNFRLDGLAGRIQTLLERKGQVILYGPPGTGKTWHAEQVARELAARTSFGVDFASLSEENRSWIMGSSPAFGGTVRLVCFHPAYGYEDFLEGYRPEAVNGNMLFAVRDGVFKRLCLDAASNPTHKFFLIIDELNRGDVPRIFGELLTVLERSRRGTKVLLPLSGASFIVPPNVLILGTMNTADRSIALLDAALRRRFGFVELMPEPATLGNTALSGIPLGAWLTALNRRICAHVGRDARNLQVGHAWLMDGGRAVDEFTRFARVVQEELIPLLEEYCYEDYSALERILGQSLVDRAGQRVRHELFAPERADDLAAALMQPCPELATLIFAGDANPVGPELETQGDP